MSDKKPILRREKSTPCADYWHTLRVGFTIAIFLFMFLPMVIR